MGEVGNVVLLPELQGVARSCCSNSGNAVLQQEWQDIVHCCKSGKQWQGCVAAIVVLLIFMCVECADVRFHDVA